MSTLAFQQPDRAASEGYWGKHSPAQTDLLSRIDGIGPILDAEAAQGDDDGQLTQKAFDALTPIRMSHIFVPESLGGMQLSPTRGLELIERITYHSGAAGWVSMVYACIGAMSAGFLPDTAVSNLFGGKDDNRFAGQGTPTGMLKRVEGGYLLTGKWSYGSGLSRATWSHSAALLDDGNGKPALDDKGNAIVLCAHAPVEKYEQIGNWDVLGLRATGSIDHTAKDVFIPEDYVFPIMTAKPLRVEEFYSLGVVGLAAVGHSGWAIGAARRMLDELETYARPKVGRPGLVGASEHFHIELAKHEGRVRAARAFLFEVWRDVEATIEGGNSVTTRQLSLIHLAKSEVHEAGAEACNFAYRYAGGTSLRQGPMQRVFREMMTATQHFTIGQNILAHVGRDLLGQAEGQVWQFYDLIQPK